MTQTLITFKNRTHAAKLLTAKLQEILKEKEGVVLSIPRGGVVIGDELARRLKVPHDVILTKKLSAPGNPELAVGAISENGNVFLDEDMVARLHITESFLEREVEKKSREIARRSLLYRGNRQKIDIGQKTVILTDDGAATGATIRIAVQDIKKRDPKRIIVALPVAPPETVAMLRKQADEVIVISQPRFFQAVGQFFDSWGEVTDEEVVKLLST